MVNELGERVEMVGHFRGGSVRPCRFRWGGRVYRIVSVSSSWESRRGASRLYHFVVRTHTDDVFEVHLDTSGMCWQLDYEYDDGA
ncbi:MAG: hypothetical protein R6U36_09080 [Candidatus Fermentibacteraceae bacterium]